MRRTTTVIVLAAALALAGCSAASDGDDKPKATATAAAPKTPEVSAEEARAACVDAWTALLQEDADAGIKDAPAECVDDPSCTSIPIP